MFYKMKDQIRTVPLSPYEVNVYDSVLGGVSETEPSAGPGVCRRRESSGRVTDESKDRREPWRLEHGGCCHVGKWPRVGRPPGISRNMKTPDFYVQSSHR